MAKVVGGCFCGAIRYQLSGDSYPSGNCHCTMCRRTSAAPFVTWLVAPIPRSVWPEKPLVGVGAEIGPLLFGTRIGGVAPGLVHQPVEHQDQPLAVAVRPPAVAPVSGKATAVRSVLIGNGLGKQAKSA